MFPPEVWVLIDESRLMPVPGFSLTLPLLTFTRHTLHHITFTHTFILDIISCLQIHITLQYAPPEVEQKYKMCHTLASIRGKAGPKCMICKGSALVQHTHISKVILIFQEKILVLLIKEHMK